MKERPILFSAPMVRALLEGRKTQTRRIMKGQPYTLRTEGFGFPTRKGGFVSQKMILDDCPYGKLEDRLYVKESSWIWCRKAPNGFTKTGRQKYRYLPHGSHSIHYVADHSQKPERASYAEPEMVWRFKTGRFMPRWASRVTLEIAEVRVQRLQEISEEDAKAEGAEWYGVADLKPNGELREGESVAYRAGFHDLWSSINGEENYQSNPWLWALTFKVVQLMVEMDRL